MWKRKRKDRRRQREKKEERKISPVLGPALVQSAEGSSPSGLAHLGLQFVSFYPPCPSFGQALELIRLIRCHEQFVSLWDLGVLWGLPLPCKHDLLLRMVSCPAQHIRTAW